eukprot:2597880-Alexandrium_andersonii.AAC.1
MVTHAKERALVRLRGSLRERERTRTHADISERVGEGQRTAIGTFFPIKDCTSCDGDETSL